MILQELKLTIVDEESLVCVVGFVLAYLLECGVTCPAKDAAKLTVTELSSARGAFSEW